MTEQALLMFSKLLDAVRSLSAAPNLEQYLNGIVSHAAELTNSELASILEYDPNTREFSFTVVPWFHSAALKGVKVPLEGSAAGWVVREQKPLILADVTKEQRHFKEVDRVSEFQTHSLIAAPLMFCGEAIGVIEVVNREGDVPYGAEDAAMLELLAPLAVLAMRGAALEKNKQDFSVESAELDRRKNDFIAITSHELRTPLGLILGHATFLREIVSEEYHDQVDAIVRNASRLKEIIESLTRVDNYQTGTARVRQNKVSVRRIAQDVADTFRSVAEQKEVTIQTKFDESDLDVEGDGSKIFVALSNLVKNAIAFSNSGGVVTIQVGIVTGHVKVSVIDTGVGIPAKDLTRVFDRFYQVESHLTRRHGGMGLGLSVVKSTVEMHGGRIWAESTEGHGSNFTFILPFVSQSYYPSENAA